MLLVASLHGIDDRVDRDVVSNAGIDHQMKSMSRRPFDVEVALDECSAIAVDGLCKAARFLFASSERSKPADLAFERGIDEYVKGIAAIPK